MPHSLSMPRTKTVPRAKLMLQIFTADAGTARQKAYPCLTSLAMLAALFVAPSPLTAAPADFPANCPTLQEKPFRLQKIGDGVYVRKGLHEIFTPQNHAAIANIGFIIGETSIAVIDSGGSFCDGTRFHAALREISNLPISHVINTHVHPDHLLGNQAFNNQGVTFVGHHNLKRALADKGEIYIENLKRIAGEEAMQGTAIVAPTLEIKDQQTINIGNRELQLIAYDTAHTNQDLVVFDKKSQILWSGDLLFDEHIPVVDGSLLGWQKRLDEIAKIPAKKVVPGHGGPLLDWPAALDDERRYLAVLTKDLRDLISQGATMLEAQTTAAASEKGKWQLFEDFNARNASAAFAELEWE